jgi:hypothetical protein
MDGTGEDDSKAALAETQCWEVLECELCHRPTAGLRQLLGAEINPTQQQEQKLVLLQSRTSKHQFFQQVGSLGKDPEPQRGCSPGVHHNPRTWTHGTMSWNVLG